VARPLPDPSFLFCCVATLQRVSIGAQCSAKDCAAYKAAERGDHVSKSRQEKFAARQALRL